MIQSNTRGDISKKHVFSIFLLYAIVQIVLVCFIRVPFSSDSLRYYQLAQECVHRGCLYPSGHNLYNSYITAPIFINYTALILSIYNCPITVLISNICLNLLQLYLLYRIACTLFPGEKIYVVLIVILYTLYLTNLGAIFFNLTEFMFNIFMLGSLYFYYHKKIIHFILSGMFLALAINVRPMGFALLLSYLIVHLLWFIHKKKIGIKIFAILGSFLFFVLLIGFVIKLQYGQFLFYSDTGSVNLLIGANDKATGAYSDRVFKKGEIGYLSDDSEFTHLEKGRFWRNQAAQWIKAHPFQWIMLFPKKLAYTFLLDDWSIPALLNTNQWNLYTIGKMVFKENRIEDVYRGEKLSFIILFVVLYIVHHIYYFILLFLMVFQFYFYRRRQMNYYLDLFKEIYWFSFFAIGIILLTVGSARYKYPIVILMLPTLTPMVAELLKSKFSFSK